MDLRAWSTLLTVCQYPLFPAQKPQSELTDTIVLTDELRIAMQMVGITTLAQAHPDLLNTADIDHLVPSCEDHPYAKKTARARAKL